LAVTAVCNASHWKFKSFGIYSLADTTNKLDTETTHGEESCFKEENCYTKEGK